MELEAIGATNLMLNRPNLVLVADSVPERKGIELPIASLTDKTL